MVAAGSVSPEMQMAAILYHLPSGLQTPRVSSIDYKDTSHIRIGPCLYDCINFTSLKALSPNAVTLGVRVSTCTFLEDTIHSPTLVLFLLPVHGLCSCCGLCWEGSFPVFALRLFLVIQHLDNCHLFRESICCPS